jgi:hypothetical protein
VTTLDWRAQIPPPRLRHADGMVLVEIDGRSVVFPSEAAARFFYAAYFELPALIEQNAYLRRQIDENALNQALERERKVAAELEELRQKQTELKIQLGKIAEEAATARRRARVLAIALKNKIVP